MWVFFQRGQKFHKFNHFSRTRILPPDPLIYVNAGGQISLHCVIETGPVEPQFILWYKEGKLVEYSSKRASIDVQSDEKGFRSHLIIDNVTLSDAGLYKCDSDLTGEESVQVRCFMLFPKVSHCFTE